MSKSRHKYKDEDGEGVASRKPSGNRIKDKRLGRALRTKNIDELMHLDDEGLDPIDIEDEIWADEILNLKDLDA